MNAPPPSPARPGAVPPSRRGAVGRGIAALAFLALAGYQLFNGQWLLAVSSALFAVMAAVGARAAARGGAIPFALLASLFALGVAAWAGSCFLPAP